MNSLSIDISDVAGCVYVDVSDVFEFRKVSCRYIYRSISPLFQSPFPQWHRLFFEPLLRFLVVPRNFTFSAKVHEPNFIRCAEISLFRSAKEPPLRLPWVLFSAKTVTIHHTGLILSLGESAICSIFEILLRFDESLFLCDPKICLFSKVHETAPIRNFLVEIPLILIIAVGNRLLEPLIGFMDIILEQEYECEIVFVNSSVFTDFLSDI